MKNLLFLFSFYCFISNVKSQTIKSCCAESATQQFAVLGKDQSFINSHESPMPYKYSSKGADVYFKVKNGPDAHAWIINAPQKTETYLIVIHEWWGLNDYVKQQAEKYGDELGVNIIALDLYDNKVAVTPDEATKYMQSVTSERATSIIKGAFEYAGNDAKIFTIGWCFGGGWSLQAAIDANRHCAGCIIFYGMPEQDITRLRTLQCDVLGIFAKKDKWINGDVVIKFQENMKQAEKKLFIESYEADHAFANPSNPHFDIEAAFDAHQKVINFIKSRM